MRPALLLTALLLLTGCQKQPDQWIALAPAGARYTTNDPAATVLPNGRLLTPLGRQITVAPHPYGLVLSRDGRTAVTANSGVGPFSVSILRDVLGDSVAVQQVPPGAENDEGVLEAVFMGLAIAPDGRTLYVAGGEQGLIVLFDLETGQRQGAIDLNGSFGGRTFEHSYLGDLTLNADGSLLYVVDQSNFRVVLVDTARRQVVASVPVGRYPFGLTLTPDEQRLYVANVGMYEYKFLEGIDLQDTSRVGLPFPPFAYGSKEAETGTTIGDYRAPGLGAPNAPEAFSVWGIDVSTPAQARVVSRTKTGHLVGAPVEGFPTVGGSSPNSVVSTRSHVYVSNGNNDSITVLDIARDSVVAEIFLELDPRLNHLRGVIPFGLALSPDHQRLYVAEAGINAVGVIDTQTNAVLGHLPVGWFPSKLAVSPDGRQLVVANAKGFGSGPNGGPGFIPGPEGSYVGSLMKGTVSVLDLPPDADLPRHTQQVLANNFDLRTPDDPAFAERRNNPVPLFPGATPSPIKYIVYITKENRTYDEVFGQLPGGRGASSLARFGRGVTVRNERDSLAGVDVMPNHLALTERFSIADNFYCDSDVSADGHRWLVGIYPNEWVETSVAASYGGKRDMKLPTTAPGVLAFVGSSGAIYPEDYNEAGSIWDHFARHHISFFNFGLGVEMAPGIEEQTYRDTGIRIPINYPIPAPLFDRTSRRYPTYNMAIPDQFRVDMFFQEYQARWASGQEPMPRVLTILLPNDHGAGVRPDEGYPFGASFQADNDLALGRLVEFLSHTPYWNEMAIFVTEDDPQGGVDHVDAHRSILMVLSPWARKGHVSQQHYSFGSIMKTMWHLLGIPYLNQYDAGASDLADFFTDTPDFTPYEALPVDPRLFDPNRALDPLDAEFNWQALTESPVMDDVETMKAWADSEDARRAQAR
jgi:YVTN family beta-propeller protein